MIAALTRTLDLVHGAVGPCNKRFQAFPLVGFKHGDADRYTQRMFLVAGKFQQARAGLQNGLHTFDHNVMGHPIHPQGKFIPPHANHGIAGAGEFYHHVAQAQDGLVAALVLTHQTRVHNIITKAQEDTRDALRVQAAAMRSTGGTIAPGEMLPVTEVRVTERVEALLREMMFVNAAPIGGPVVGTSNFAEDFVRRGPTDSAGRSLRDFDLQDRLFRYPLSFIIYTDAFDALPDVVLDRLYQRLDQILAGTDTTGDFDHIDAPTRQAIREILLETKPAFAEAVGG